MIVLGPRDADLNGAPPCWREGNWRPDTLRRPPHLCAFTTIPFDKCDLVFEYDARRPQQPMPFDQGWKLVSEGDGNWEHDPLHGTLRFHPEGPTPSFWRRSDQLRPMPDRGAAHGLLMMIDGPRETREGGLDILFEAAPPNRRARGMRGCWSDRWHWRALDGSDAFPLIKAAAEPTLDRAWHGFGLDAELIGPEIDAGDVDPNDGGKTIGGLDGLISNDDRRRFRYGTAEPEQAVAIFGMTERDTRVAGQIRNVCVSFPGRFVRASFRALTLAETTRLRLILCLGAEGEVENAGAVIRVLYTSPSIGMRENALPEKEAPPGVIAFDPANPGGAVEVDFDLEGLKPGEPLRFTVERDWRSGEDRLRDTVHLLSAVLEEAR